MARTWNFPAVVYTGSLDKTPLGAQFSRDCANAIESFGKVNNLVKANGAVNLTDCLNVLVTLGLRGNLALDPCTKDLLSGLTAEQKAALDAYVKEQRRLTAEILAAQKADALAAVEAEAKAKFLASLETPPSQ